jgi:hypothetical protein
MRKIIEQRQSKTLRKVKIDFGPFMCAFWPGTNELEPCSGFLELDSGEIHFLYETDEGTEMVGGSAQENALLRDRLSRSPNQYVEIPALDHSEHHEILQKFLSSDWTSDGGVKQHAEKAYQGSIGRWIYDVDDDATVDAFRNFQGDAIEARADEFLRNYGIEPDWH